MRDDDCERYILYYKGLPPGCDLDQYVRCFNKLITKGAIAKGSPADKRVKKFLKFGRDEVKKDFHLE